MAAPIATLAELRAVYDDSESLAMLRISFARAMAMPHVRWAMTRRAIARRTRPAPTTTTAAQQRLI